MNAQPSESGNWENIAEAYGADPFLQEVWAMKEAAAARAGYDIRRLCEQAKALEATLPNPVAPRPDTHEELQVQRQERKAS